MSNLVQMENWLLRLEVALIDRNPAALLRLYTENEQNENWIWYSSNLPDELIERYDILTDRANDFLYHR